MHIFATAVIGTEAFFFAYTGWLGFARPMGLAEKLGLHPDGAAGLNEVRSQYGGFYACLAIALVISLPEWIPMTAALAAAIIAFGGLMLGRLVSVAADKSLQHYTPTLKSLTFLDPLGFVLSLLALWTIIGQR